MHDTPSKNTITIDDGKPFTIYNTKLEIDIQDGQPTRIVISGLMEDPTEGETND